MSGDLDLCIDVLWDEDVPILRRTLLALAEAAAFAGDQGFRTELVVRTSRTSRPTSFASADELAPFHKHRILVHPQPASERFGGGGVSADHVLFLKAGDMVGFNTFTAFLSAARGGPKPAVLIPNYIYAFGPRACLFEMTGGEAIGKASLFATDTIGGTLFVARSFLRSTAVLAAPSGDGLDWAKHAVSLGARIISVPHTVVFRQARNDSEVPVLNRNVWKNASVSGFYKPETFLSLTTEDANAAGSLAPDGSISSRFLNDDICLTVAAGVNAIHPAVDVSNVAHIGTMGNWHYDRRPAEAYRAACELVGGSPFSDVVLLPFLSRGGGEKYILEVCRAITRSDPQRRFLFLAGEAFPVHEGLEQLPNGAVFVDLFTLGEGLAPDTVELITFRLLQHAAPAAWVHLKSCGYVARCVRRFAHRLPAHRFVFYRFCDQRRTFHGELSTQGYDFELLSDMGERFTLVITDNRSVEAHDLARLDHLRDRYVTLYVETLTGTEDRCDRRPTHRLLWASRLDRQKRPDLVPRIARALQARDLGVEIHIYGSAVLGAFDHADLEGTPGLSYQGGFSRFDLLPLGSFDALLYTSVFDGLPNVILEAMGQGLPVIAPDVGGIAEAVCSDTGVLIEDDQDDEILAGRYADAVEILYEDAARLVRRGQAARDLIATRHSSEAFSRAVDNLFARRSDGSPQGAEGKVPDVGAGALSPGHDGSLSERRNGSHPNSVSA